MNDFNTRPDTFPPVVKYLIIINVLVFIAQITVGREYGLTERIIMYPITNPSFRPYQIITHMFAHGGFTHILFNMFGLWMFGRILENVWGSRRFLNFYMICGIGAALVYLLTKPAEPALGASGAIMGVFVAFGYLFPNTPLYIYFIPIPIKAKWVMIGLVAIDLFSGFNILGRGNDNIAHFAHLGGALTGFILVFIWNKTNRQKFY